MPKNNLPFHPSFLLVSLFASLATYLYCRQSKDSSANNFNENFLETSLNYAPTALASFLTATSSLISVTLIMNPEKENFRLTQRAKIAESFTEVAPSLVASLVKAENYLAKVLFGERGDAINEIVNKGTSIFEQIIRVPVISERLYQHHLARAVQNDDGEMQIRYLRNVAHTLEVVISHGIEIAVCYLWWAANQGLLRFVPTVTDKNKLTILSFFYLGADSVEAIINHFINNRFLAFEIWADSISGLLRSMKLAGVRQYTIDEPKFVRSLRSFSSELIDKAENAIRKTEEIIENRIKAAVDVVNQERLKLEAEYNKLKENLEDYIKKSFAEALALEEALKMKMNNAVAEVVKEKERISEDLAKVKEDLAKAFDRLYKMEEFFKDQIKNFELHFAVVFPAIEKHGKEYVNKAVTSIQFLWRKKMAIKKTTVNEEEKLAEEPVLEAEAKRLEESKQYDKAEEIKVHHNDEHHNVGLFGEGFHFNLFGEHNHNNHHESQEVKKHDSKTPSTNDGVKKDHANIDFSKNVFSYEYLQFIAKAINDFFSPNMYKMDYKVKILNEERDEYNKSKAAIEANQNLKAQIQLEKISFESYEQTDSLKKADNEVYLSFFSGNDDILVGNYAQLIM